MTELSFAKSFLSTLDSRPVKLPADHVFDPRTFAPRFPITLPRLSDPPHPPMPKKVKTVAAPGSSKSITVHLKSARNPVLDIKLDKIALNTATTQELKETIQQRIRPTNTTDPDAKVPLDKIKLLWKRKPVQTSLIGDIVANEPDILSKGGNVEFSVMVLGGASVIPDDELPKRTTKSVPSTEQNENMAPEPSGDEKASTSLSAADIPKSPAFWADLEVYLRGKVKDESEAARLGALFKSAWEASL
ncbi:hypothetical protein FQN57_006759 [Myotisia sp. PD_48]|nr:hypothetical protein FQN57_006759 [Myotisia sp. PD_48]